MAKCTFCLLEILFIAISGQAARHDQTFADADIALVDLFAAGDVKGRR